MQVRGVNQTQLCPQSDVPPLPPHSPAPMRCPPSSLGKCRGEKEVNFSGLLGSPGVGTWARGQPCAQYHAQGQRRAGNRQGQVQEVGAGFLDGSGSCPGWGTAYLGLSPGLPL